MKVTFTHSLTFFVVNGETKLQQSVTSVLLQILGDGLLQVLLAFSIDFCAARSTVLYMVI